MYGKQPKSSAIMSGYKLYYFDVRARAEVCRLSFSAANIEFEDIRLSGEEWAKEKASKYVDITVKRITTLWCKSGRKVYGIMFTRLSFYHE